MSKTMCFTGRRPKDLFGYVKENYVPLVNKLTDELIQFYKEQGFDTFITGGAQGFDQLAFWAVDRMKRQGYMVKNIVYAPFKKQENKWLKNGLFSQSEYQLMLSRADEVRYCDAEIDVLIASKWKINTALHSRNHDMVNSSILVFGLYPGFAWLEENCVGGTAECLRYAKEKEKKIYQMNPFTLECEYVQYKNGEI